MNTPTPNTSAEVDKLEPASAVFGSTRPRRRRVEPISGCVNVLPDVNTKFGLLSYNVPEDLEVRVGDAVRIPYGRKEVHGMVTGPGDSSKANKNILEVFGTRSDPSDISLAYSVAKYHFCGPESVLKRLSPTSGRGAVASDDYVLQVVDAVTDVKLPNAIATSRRSLILLSPTLSQERLAARLAWDMTQQNDGQILILCPSTTAVTAVLKNFTHGAARLDSRAPRGAWKGFCEGSLRVGVGTRSAALYAANKLDGIIVVDEAHPGHVEQSAPYTNARDLASSRTRALRIPLRLISHIGSPQAFGASQDVFTLGAKSTWPRMNLINRKELDPNDRWFPARVKSALTQASNAGKNPVVVASRKEAVRRCMQCRSPRPCAECNSSLCKHKETEPCPNCNASTQVRMYGWDKERLMEIVGTRAKVVSLSELSKQTNAGCVVLFDLDAIIATSDFIPGRLAAGALISAAKAAGAKGHVIALSETPDPVVDELFAKADLMKLTQRFHTAARKLGLPPLGRLVYVRTKRVHAPDVSTWPGNVHGPRAVGKNEWEIMVRLKNEQLAELEPHMKRLQNGGNTKIQVQ